MANNYIPEPNPASSPVEISAFYYPGTEQMAEWDQVEQTMPYIKPLLGWYDEGNPEVVDWQIKWAVEHGISSFCVDWYWNKGVQRLDHWVKAFYMAKFRKYLKWYIMWANHNEVGAHSTEDQINVTRFWLDNFFKAPEYYTIDGRPVVVVWSSYNIDRDFRDEAARNGETLQPGEGVKRALELSDRMVREAGLPGIHFIEMYHSADYSPELVSAAKSEGYKGQMVYNFRHTALKQTPPEKFSTGDTDHYFPFEFMMDAAPAWWKLTYKDNDIPFWPIIPTGWDDRPRSFDASYIVYGRTVDKFRRICEDCRRFCDVNGVKRVIISPVNEWQEGSYIEPNEEFGFGMYDALRDAFCTRPAEGFPPNLTPKDIGMGPYDYPPMPHLTLTSWDFSKDVQGWYRNPYGTPHLRIADGALHFMRSGSERPAIRTRIQPFAAERFQKFTVRMRITPNTAVPAKGDEKMTLRWGTPENPIFTKDLAMNNTVTAATAVIADGQFHEYTLALSGHPFWKGNVDELWFDPIPLSTAYVDIQWMRFE